MYKISKEITTFAAAHRLLQLPTGHKCRNLHGHNWKVTVTLFAKELDSNGFVMDFNELKQIKKRIDEDFDHSVIISSNDRELLNFCIDNNCKHIVLPNNEISAEVLSSEIFHNYVMPILKPNIERVIVSVYETETSKASYTYKNK